MHISELLASAPYRKAFTKALYQHAEDTSIGTLLTATQVNEILDSIESPTADALILHEIIGSIATEDGERNILAVKNAESGLIIYGYKIGYTQFDDVTDKDEPTTSYFVGMLGSSLPDGIRLQIDTEEVGSGDKKYRRPVAILMKDFKDGKGRTRTARLECGLLDTIKQTKIEYREWVTQALDRDEDELVEAGILAQWAEPKLGSGGGGRVNLTQLGEDAAQFGPQTYQVLEVKIDSTGEYDEVSFVLCLDGGAPIETWKDKAFVLSKSRERGGIGYSDMVGDALDIGQKYYLHVLGVKPKMQWDKVNKTDILYIDKQGRSWNTIDAYLSDVPTINPRLLKAASAPAVQVAPALIGAAPVKSAAIAEEPNFDDIPF